MDTTKNLALPYIMAAQAQKHVTHNAALRALDAIVHLSVVDRDLATAPEEPLEGQRHIVSGSATGIWADRGGEIAAFQDGAWAYFSPNSGWIAWVAAESMALVFDGAQWVSLTEAASLNPAALVGVNATADMGNRLAVKSDAVLLSHDDTTPGSGDMRLKLNKAAAGGTASVLYQSDWSGRAEFGTVGDDDFHIKVSPDGATWHEALIIDRTSGAVRMPASVPLSAPYNLLKDAGRFAGSPEPQSGSVGSFTAPSYVLAANGATIAGGPKFITNNNDYGGTAGALDVDVRALIDKLKDAGKRRYGVEFYLLDITAGTGTGTARTINGLNHYLPFALLTAPLPPQWAFNCHIRVKSGSVGCTSTLASVGDMYIDGVRRTASQQITPADGWRQLTRLYNRDPRQFEGYDNIMHNIFATPETRFYLAAPLLVPGAIPIGPEFYYGVVPSLEAWR
ncbi:DUF2793 domain-containing protein [Hyphomicrobium sp. D-2]|uniref:DUF2793 domain-containing protein n=1 Tax=Hyphomicrobium sp. D-2 TaxID=3041621 RepID=UPI00245657F5|nr:DUF2793 domain-containing protein [Hyphomicrobium sp. D-2]MDH4980681.1 DUF2793 domain-containing protein [Hyphomicrobium sp. D-2]